MKASFKRPRVKSSIGATSQPPSSGDSTTEEFVNPTAIVDPPSSSSSNASLQSMLDTVKTVQAAHGQILVDVLTEFQALHVDLVSARWSPPPPPFNDDL